MSDTDSFIDEVTEEVRRDRLFAMFKRYGWVAGLVVVLIVGGAAWSEFRKAQTQAAAEDLGDAILASLAEATPAARQAQLETVTPHTGGADAVVSLLLAAEAREAGDIDYAVTLLDEVAVNGEIPDIYRQIAAFKSLVLQADTMDPGFRRQQLEALAMPGAPLSLLAQEQLALQDISQDDTLAAIDRYQAIVQDAGVGQDLQQRALQMIVALGGTPDVANLPGPVN